MIVQPPTRFVLFLFSSDVHTHTHNSEGASTMNLFLYPVVCVRFFYKKNRCTFFLFLIERTKLTLHHFSICLDLMIRRSVCGRQKWAHTHTHILVTWATSSSSRLPPLVAIITNIVVVVVVRWSCLIIWMRSTNLYRHCFTAPNPLVPQLFNCFAGVPKPSYSMKGMGNDAMNTDEIFWKTASTPCPHLTAHSPCPPNKDNNNIVHMTAVLCAFIKRP